MRVVHVEVVAVPLLAAAIALFAIPRRDQPPPASCPPPVVIAPRILPPPPSTPAPTPPIEVREVPFDRSALAQEMTFRGTLVRGVRWHDRAGDNVVVFSQLVPDESSSYLFASHYVRDAAGVRLVRVVKESDEGCDDDLISGFHAAYLVTDLDDDSLGEITFGYFHGACVTDVSPGRFKLFLLEGGAKYVLRGEGYHAEVAWQPPTPAASSDTPEVFARHLRRWWPWLADQWHSQTPL